MFYEPFAEINEIYKFGRDGVIIFFILSGFIISWCASERDKTFAVFAINRASRIYSVALPALLLGMVVNMFTSLNNAEPLHYPFEKLWIYFPIYITFTGNFWNLSETPPGNFPYWSLNYEVWYYIIFAALFYGGSRWKYFLAIFFMLCVGPNILQLFPLWLMGSALYFISRRIKLNPLFSILGVIISTASIISIKYLQLDNYADKYNYLLFSNTPQLLGDYLIGIMVLLNLTFALNLDFLSHTTSCFLIRKLASYSFSFYLFHIPVFSLLNHFVIHNNSLVFYMIILIISCLVIVLLAHFTEHKKNCYRINFRNFVDKFNSNTV